METEEELTKSRDRIREQLEDEHWALKHRKEQGKSLYSNYRGLHQIWWSMGNHSMCLAEVARSRTEFATSGLYVRELHSEAVSRWQDIGESYRRNVGSDLKWGFYLTVLSGDSRLIDAVATDILTMEFDTEYGGGWGSSGSYWRTCALADLYRGNDDRAREYLDLYPAEDDAPMTDLLADLHEAMLAADEAATRDALAHIAADHEAMLGDSRPWKAAFSHTAGAHLLVARHRGLDVTAEQLGEAVPVQLDEYDVGENVDLPSPEYVDQQSIPE